MRAVYRELPWALQAQVDGHYAIHSYATSRDKVDPSLMTTVERNALPPVRQAMVLDHGDAWGRSLYIGSHVRAVEGLTPLASEQLIDRLMNFATQARFVFTHQWTQNDLVL